MALQTKTISANGSKAHHKFTLTVTEDSTSTSGNSSTLSYTFKLSPVVSGHAWAIQGTNIAYSITIGSNTASGYIPEYDGTSTVTVKSGTVTQAHDSDGTKTITVKFSVTDRDGETYTCGAASASGTMTLTPISTGLVYIDNGSGWDAYQIYIDNGSSWDQYIAYIDNGSSWDQYS